MPNNFTVRKSIDKSLPCRIRQLKCLISQFGGKVKQITRKNTQPNDKVWNHTHRIEMYCNAPFFHYSIGFRIDF